ncbi:MAG: response regulator transcription factor [Chloroflexi bacterium]|nr:response regulator transcription factor [Chloroflexota bacterium]
MSNTPTILLIEDDEGIAEPLIFGLQSEEMRVLRATNGADGLRLARNEHPDVILLDVMLPDLDGFSICRTLRRESTVPIVMLTARGQEMDRVMGLELGADDYIVKPFSFREMLARVRAIMRRLELDRKASPRTSDRITVGELVLDRTARQLFRRGTLVDLSPREFQLIAVLMDRIGQALSRQELLDLAWGEEWVGNPRTLDVHIRWLREKIEDNSATPIYIETVRGHGYRFVDPTRGTVNASA